MNIRFQLRYIRFPTVRIWIRVSDDFTIVEAADIATNVVVANVTSANITTIVEAVVRYVIRTVADILGAVVMRPIGIVAVVVVDYGFGYGRLRSDAAENAFGIMVAEHRPDSLEQERAARNP